MANVRLDSIAKRQRKYLVLDVMIASLAAVILIIQVLVLSGSQVPIAEPSPRMAPETIYIYGSAPNPLQDGKQPGAVATNPDTNEVPGT